MIGIGCTILGTNVEATTKSYGNGVYCNKQKCWVNWDEAKQQIAGIVIGGWSSSLASISR
ncbi:class II bacteriocin [Enterococcus faecalis]|uniref:class II bacteriocin n=1 Tax=Enterococcus faecalis TaxID=1351 RepID=UPI001EFB02A2|nr:class II bacteriocin [Enterococcus faecalis]